MSGMTAQALESRLQKIAGLLENDSRDEAANAAAAASRLLRQNNLRWPDVIRVPSAAGRATSDPAPKPPAKPATRPPRRHPRDWHQVISDCLQQAVRLTPLETGFLRDLAQQERWPTARQMAVIRGIAARLNVPH